MIETYGWICPQYADGRRKMKPMQDNDLISRAALVEDLSYCAPELFFDKDYLLHKIMRQPTVDAVPVVKCKDCKYSYFADNRVPAEQSLVCERTGCDVTPDWFCAGGRQG